ncbi:glycosyltransferase [Modestobacter excelsi]|uniref:glycosyltransferase n=1 Tax=Modestobacter excelsi TaxID=2213161 RepID=UPI00110CA021|nr:nucleotide disphospho-sugar-binding domain-containing protein [Modestobacter excelsi]
MLGTFAGGTGHFLPTLPYARQLRARGHQVRYACQQAMLPVVEAAGFPAVDTGGATLLPPDERRPLAPVDRAHEQRVVADFFIAQVGTERAARTSALIAQWRPDLVLRDEMDVGAGVAAEAAGIPSADVIVIAAGGFLDAERLRPPIEQLRVRHGLPRDPATPGLHGDLTLDPVPPGLRDPADSLPDTAIAVRPPILDDLVLRDPASPVRQHARRSLYLTLGTIFAQESGDLFLRVLAGLRELDVDVLVTVGRELDPAELGPQPGHIRVERFVPLPEALRGRDLVVSHAGSGTVVATLALGLPSLLLPMGADQPWTAERCRALGVSRVLDPLACSPTEVTNTVSALLDDSPEQHAALAIAQQTAELPTTADAAGLLEGLAR